MSITLSITESNALTALRSFLLAILPAGIEVLRSQGNQVPEPQGPDFVMMTPLLKERLETNVDAFDDVAFTGSIAGSTLSVTAMQIGEIAVGAQLLGSNISPNTLITALGTGTGGIGTYTVGVSQTVSSQTIAAGTQTLLQPTQLSVQIDVYGPNSSDNSQIITTVFRDEYAVDQFSTYGYDVTPLYASDAKQTPFISGEAQYEERWTLTAVMQMNPVVTVPQQFASQLEASLRDVQAKYPA